MLYTVPHTLSFPSQIPWTPGSSRTGPMCPTVEGYNPTVLPIPESRDPRDNPDRSRVSHSGGPQSHCPKCPRVPGHTRTSRTGPMCPTVEVWKFCPTCPRVPGLPGHPGQVLCVPQWRATIPLSFSSQSPRHTRTSRTGPMCPIVEVWRFCPTCPRVPGHTRTSRTGPMCPTVEVWRFCPTCPRVPGLPGHPGEVPCTNKTSRHNHQIT